MSLICLISCCVWFFEYFIYVYNNSFQLIIWFSQITAHASSVYLFVFKNRLFKMNAQYMIFRGLSLCENTDGRMFIIVDLGAHIFFAISMYMNSLRQCRPSGMWLNCRPNGRNVCDCRPAVFFLWRGLRIAGWTNWDWTKCPWSLAGAVNRWAAIWAWKFLASEAGRREGFYCWKKHYW